jgi:hypothetical protein
MNYPSCAALWSIMRSKRNFSMQEQERFFSFLQHPSDLAELQAGPQIFGTDEIRSFLTTVHDRDGTLRELAPLLATSDGFHAGALALVCGSLVERGGDASIAVDAVLELMLRQLQQAQTYREKANSLEVGALFQLWPEATRAHHSLPFTLLAAMTMLCRDKSARRRWQLRQEVIALVNELEEAYETLFYVKEVLSLLDDQEFLVLDPLNKRGFHVRLEGVQDRMYHCYALLQHAILEQAGPGYLDAEPTDPLVVRYAQNRDLTPKEHQSIHELFDEQHFSFSSFAALPLDDESASLDPLLFFPGSASFFEIPALDGMRILLIGKRVMHFRWQPANMYPVLHEALTSHVEIVRELAAVEVENRLQQIRQSRSQA